ncbi:hypothetical protein EGW08_000690 [Elysia chlorotica]|uniref:G-protein coupled receptors family 2 profile 2 domain-containing protein n=1 Tax=Elysia chlorotica TaxID=188477 RepID=A0A433UCK6_ELYCH|nr:hypothetical protein EGW08_000690 [Elysia chlorotica]
MSGEVFKSVEKWVLQISCEHYQSLYTVTTEDDFLKGASEQTDVCFVSLLAPEDLTELERCDPQFFWPREKRESTECRHRDLRLAKLCSEVDQLAFSTSHKGQNLFCVLCDGEIPFTNTFSHRVLTTFPPTSLITSRPAPISPAPIYIPPLTLLLGVSRRSQPSLPKCSNVTWWDDSGECRPAHCSPGKLIDESGKCLSAIEQIRGLGYKLSIVFEPRKQEMVTEQDINSLSNTISGVVENLSFESMSDINITVVRQNGTGYSKLKQVSVCSYFTGNDTVGRDEYESQLLKFVSQIWTVKRANGTNDSIILKPVLLGNELKDLELTDREDGQLVIELPQPQKDYDQGYETYKSTNNERYLSNNGMKFTTPPMRPFSFLTMPPQISSRPTTPISQPSSFTPAYIPKSGEIILTQSHARKISRIAQWTLKDEFIDVTHSLECPYVTVNITNITISNKLPKLNFLFMGETLQVNSEQKISVVKGRLQICISLYKKLTSPIFMRTKQSVLEHVQYYIEVICVILSVVCLLLSALTYCLFPSLRSLPGLNNLSLCVSLAVAQVCLLITARWGVNNLLPRGYCTMHAVLLHFSWLASFAWMSVCCIHMFRVFTAQSTKFTDNRSDKKRYLHYCMYGFGVPTILVIATYAINAGVTSGNSSGYNDDICFLDTSHSIWTLVLSLLAPLVLVILTNSVMFVLTVRQIVQVTNLQEQRRSRDRQGVITYVKLSTLTGLLGAVVVVAVQLNSSVLSLLTSPLMALQGVFIFVSFTCNQRVRHLYVELFGRLGLRCGKSSEKTTSTGSSTVRSSSNNPTRSQTLSTSI